MKTLRASLALVLVAAAIPAHATDYCTVSSGGHTYVFVTKGSIAILQGGTEYKVVTGALGSIAQVAMPPSSENQTVVNQALTQLQPFNGKVTAIVGALSSGQPLTPAQQAYYNSVGITPTTQAALPTGAIAVVGDGTLTVTSGKTTTTVGSGGAVTGTSNGVQVSAPNGSVAVTVDAQAFTVNTGGSATVDNKGNVTPTAGTVTNSAGTTLANGTPVSTTPTKVTVPPTQISVNNLPPVSVAPTTPAQDLKNPPAKLPVVSPSAP